MHGTFRKGLSIKTILGMQTHICVAFVRPLTFSFSLSCSLSRPFSHIMVHIYLLLLFRKRTYGPILCESIVSDVNKFNGLRMGESFDQRSFSKVNTQPMYIEIVFLFILFRFYIKFYSVRTTMANFILATYVNMKIELEKLAQRKQIIKNTDMQSTALKCKFHSLPKIVKGFS